MMPNFHELNFRDSKSSDGLSLDYHDSGVGESADFRSLQICSGFQKNELQEPKVLREATATMRTSTVSIKYTENDISKALTNRSTLPGHELNTLTGLRSKNPSTHIRTEQPQHASLVDEDEDGDTIIHIAIILKLYKLCYFLIQQIIFLLPKEYLELLNHENKLRQTPLHLATLCGSEFIVQVLINLGVDRMKRDRHGNTALHLACKHGHLSIVKSLINKGNNSDSKKVTSLRNYDGFSCLHLAVLEGRMDIVEYLLDIIGADVNERDDKAGRSILHLAIENKDLTIVLYLLHRSDTNINATTYSGKTPLNYAAGLKQAMMEKILLVSKAENQVDTSDEEDEETGFEENQNVENIYE